LRGVERAERVDGAEPMRRFAAGRLTHTSDGAGGIRPPRRGGTVGGRLSPGDTAPDFTLSDDTGTEVSLSGLRGRKVIVYFYPAAMTPGCTKQACDFSESLDSLKAAGYAVVGIAPDQPAKLAKFRDKEHLTITLLSDPDKGVLTQWGAFGEKQMYGKTVHGVIRSTVVLDEFGTVTDAWYNVRATGHVAKLRRDLGLE
jgi:peroxiredoxin Q/BCP